MALKVHKTKDEELVGPPEEETLAQKVDRIGAVVTELGQLAVKLQESKLHKQIVKLEEEGATLEGEIRTLLEDPTTADEDVVTANGDLYLAKLFPVPKKRTLTKPGKIFEMLPHKQILKIVNFRLGDLDKYLTPEQVGEIVEEKRQGKRKFKVEAK